MALVLNEQVRGVNEQILEHQYGQHYVNHALNTLAAFLERHFGQQIFGPERPRQEHGTHQHRLLESISGARYDQRRYHYRQHPIEYGHKGSHIIHEDMQSLPIFPTKPYPKDRYYRFGAKTWDLTSD